MWGNITKKKGPITYLIRGPKNCEGTFIKYNWIKYIRKRIHLTVTQHLSNTTESNISENNEWKSFQLSLCICVMYFAG